LKRKTTAKKATKAPRRARSRKAPVPAMPDSDSDRFAHDLLTRGEAAPLDEKGKLRKGATHVIRKKKRKEPEKVERARFYLF
jgi:hypothetical protein